VGGWGGGGCKGGLVQVFSQRGLEKQGRAKSYESNGWGIANTATFGLTAS